MAEQNNWHNWKPEDDDLKKLLVSGTLQNIQPNHPLLQLKKLLMHNLIWAVVISAGYVAMLFLFPYWQIMVSLGVTILFNAYTMYVGWGLYRSVADTVSGSRPLLDELKLHYANISKWGEVQLKMGLLVYPFAAVAGYFCGGMASSGKTVEELLSRQVFVIALPITVVVLVPLGYFFAKWLFQKSFGKHLRNLKGVIDGLETDK